MSMYFYDDTDDWPEYQTIRDEIRALDQEHLELDAALKEAESALKSDPANSELIHKVDWLRRRLDAVARKLDESLSMYR